MTLVLLLLSGSCDVGVIFWVCWQGFSQKVVLPSYGRLFLEEIQGKFTQSFMGKHAFWRTSFQCLAKRMCVGNATAESSPCFVVMPY